MVLFLSDNGPSDQGDHKAWSNPNWRLDGHPVRWGNDPSIMPGPGDTFGTYGAAWANVSSTPFRQYKGYSHEGGIATPVIVRWPKVIKKRGVITHQTGHIIDIMATCLELAGIDYPSSFNGRNLLPLEGKSLVPIFQDHQRPGHEALYWENGGNRAVRKGKWKLVSLRDKQWELYDMESDRTEMNNLAEKYPKRVNQMDEIYQKWFTRCTTSLNAKL